MQKRLICRGILADGTVVYIVADAETGCVEHLTYEQIVYGAQTHLISNMRLENTVIKITDSYDGTSLAKLSVEEMQKSCVWYVLDVRTLSEGRDLYRLISNNGETIIVTGNVFAAALRNKRVLNARVVDGNIRLKKVTRHTASLHRQV